MGEEKVLNTDVSKNTSRLDFLYKRISMPRICLAAWLHVPEFVEEITALDSSGIFITDAVVLEVCDKLMAGKFQNKEIRKDFYFGALKRGINHLKRALDGEE